MTPGSKLVDLIYFGYQGNNAKDFFEGIDKNFRKNHAEIRGLQVIRTYGSDLATIGYEYNGEVRYFFQYSINEFSVLQMIK